MVLQSTDRPKKATKAGRDSKSKVSGSVASSQSAKIGPARRETCAHGLEHLAESTIPSARRETCAHGSKALVDTEVAEPCYLFSSSKIAQSASMTTDNCCGIMSLVNVLDNEEHRRAFCGGNLARPELAFVEFMKRAEPEHRGEVLGYTHIQMQNYMKELVRLGKMKSFFFRRLKNYSAEDLLGPRGQDKRLKPGDNLVVFGRARKSDHAKAMLKQIQEQVGKAKGRGASEQEIKKLQLQLYVQKSSAKCNTSNPTHAVGVRFRTTGEEQKLKRVAQLVDPAMGVAKDLDVYSYGFSMAERKETSEQGKEQYEAHYYVFRAEF